MMDYPAQPFNPDNQAWQRFLTLASEHFEVLFWKDGDGLTTWVSLADRASGHVVTLVPYDSSEQTQPVAVLGWSTVDGLAAVGPYPGALAGNDAAAQWGMSGSVDSTCVALLHSPASGEVPVDDWVEVPAPVSQRMWAPSPPKDSPVVLLLIKHNSTTVELDTMVIVGPFESAADARAWHTDQDADRLILAIDQPHPPRSTSLG